MSDRILKDIESFKELGFVVYKVSTTIGPSTLIMYNSGEKRFVFIVHDPGTGFYSREDVFLYMAESKVEGFSGLEVPTYLVHKNDEGFWEIKNIKKYVAEEQVN